MKTPSLEEVFKHFKKAATVKCLLTKKEYFLDLDQMITEEFEPMQYRVFVDNQLGFVDKKVNNILIYDSLIGFAKIIYKTPSKYESLEKRVEVLEQEVKKANHENEEKSVWDKHPSKETYEELKSNFVSFVNYSVEKGWLPKPNNFNLSEVKRIIDKGKVKIPSYIKGRNKGNAEMIITDHLDKEKSKEERVKYYAKVSDVLPKIDLPEPLNFNFGVDWGKPDSHNDVFERNSIKFHVQDNSYQRYLDSLELLSLRQENTQLKLRVEELEAVNAEILKGDSKEIITEEDWGKLAVAESDLKLEVGKWYTYNKHADCIFCVTAVNEYYYGAYGISYMGEWTNDDNWSEVKSVQDGYLSLATESEVLEALTKEAVKRGFVEGAYFMSKRGEVEIYGARYAYNIEKNEFYVCGMIAFKDGEWCEIIPTIKKEDAEEKLGIKIID